MTTTVRARVNFKELGAQLMSSSHAPLASSSQNPSRSGLLVVLDVHGVLVDRIGRGKEKGRRARTVAQRKPWRNIKKNLVWLRPHLQHFLSILLRRHDVAIWSSAKAETVADLLAHLSGSMRMEPSITDRLSFVWDRSRCKPDVERGGHATIKYLGDLWDCSEYRGRYTACNTLLLDDSAAKFRHFSSSGILVPEYNVDVLKHDYSLDDTLLWVLLYIEYLIQDASAKAQASGWFDIAISRPDCMSLEDFIIAGKLEARRISNSRQRRSVRSLAFVFMRDLAPTYSDRTPPRAQSSQLLLATPREESERRESQPDVCTSGVKTRSMLAKERSRGQNWHTSDRKVPS